MTCKICYCEIDDSEPVVPMENCIHMFHVDCFKKFLEVNLNDGKLPFKCPIETCRCLVNPINVESILSFEDKKKYQERQLGKYVDQNEDVSWCPTPGCSYSFFFEKGDHEFECKLCKKKYCLDCQCEWHEGMTCGAYRVNKTVLKEDYEFMSFVRGNKLKQCRKCKMFVQKNQGCDHMTC